MLGLVAACGGWAGGDWAARAETTLVMDRPGHSSATQRVARIPSYRLRRYPSVSVRAARRANTFTAYCRTRSRGAYLGAYLRHVAVVGRLIEVRGAGGAWFGPAAQLVVWRWVVCTPARGALSLCGHAALSQPNLETVAGDEGALSPYPTPPHRTLVLSPPLALNQQSRVRLWLAVL